jgi:hypothetical protein
MNRDEVKNNLLAPAQWLRILIMAGFILAAWVASLVLVVVMITQTVTVLIAGGPNHNLRQFGLVASAYLHQIVSFLVYGTEDRPFPFAPFPDCSDGVYGACAAPPTEPPPHQADGAAPAQAAPDDVRAEYETFTHAEDAPFPPPDPDPDQDEQQPG